MLDKVKSILGIGIKKELGEYTVIGNNVVVEGKISNGKLFVEGTFKPSLSSTFEKLQISNSGVFCSTSGVIHTIGDAEIAGSFSGDIEADNVYLRTGAIVTGTISYKYQFICEEDVVLNATVNLVNSN